MIVAAPIIGSNPSSGFLFGAAAQVAVFRGDPSTTRITSGIASLSFSTKKHVLFNVRFDSFSDGNQWFVKGDNRFQNTSQNIYGFGAATPGSAAVNSDFIFGASTSPSTAIWRMTSMSAEEFCSTRTRASNRRRIRIPIGPCHRTSHTASRTTCRRTASNRPASASTCS